MRFRLCCGSKIVWLKWVIIKRSLDEAFFSAKNYQCWSLCYQPKLNAAADGGSGDLGNSWCQRNKIGYLSYYSFSRSNQLITKLSERVKFSGARGSAFSIWTASQWHIVMKCMIINFVNQDKDKYVNIRTWLFKIWLALSRISKNIVVTFW